MFNVIPITQKKKEELCNFFYKAQRVYHALSRFAYLYKLKKKNHLPILYDFCMTPLHFFPKWQKIILLHYNTIYTFRLSDLVGIWLVEIYNSSELSPSPQKLKNPYTNLTFKVHNLYNIYFALINTSYSIPPILTELFQMGFNLKKLTTDCYPRLRDMAINNFVKDGDIHILFDDIIQMFREYNNIVRTVSIKNNPSINYKKNIIKKTRYLLKLYYLYNYTVNPLMQTRSLATLKKKLRTFEMMYPYFGTKYVFKDKYMTNNAIIGENIIIHN